MAFKLSNEESRVFMNACDFMACDFAFLKDCVVETKSSLALPNRVIFVLEFTPENELKPVRSRWFVWFIPDENRKVESVAVERIRK